jgi:NitT/TauT family transport system substrate-binding protein
VTQRGGKLAVSYRRSSAFLIALAIVLLAAPSVPANADDVVRVGTAQAQSLPFIPLQLGEQAGIWAKNGITLEISALRGDGQVQQAMTAGNIDFGIGSGPGLGFLVKGVPAIGIASLYGNPDDLALVLSPKLPYSRLSDLKGKRIAVTTGGSLTDWLVRQIAVSQGWDPTAITAVPLGDSRTQVAAMVRGDVDGLVAGTEVGYEMQEQGRGKVVMFFGSVVHDFMTHVMFGRSALVQSNPDLVRRFLKGWFESVAYMKTHRDEAIAVGAKFEELSPSVIAKTYDADIGQMSLTGDFSAKALKHLAVSFVQLGILQTEPDATKLVTTAFRPIKP